MLDQTMPLTGGVDRVGGPTRPRGRLPGSAYSPYENLPPAAGRPALLVTGALHDPRVLVHEPAKWVAALRAGDPGAGAGVDPADPVSSGTVLFRCETGDGGHHGPAGRYAALGYEAEVQAWLLTAFGLG